MIISHKHEYLFVEIPHTATTAIGDELCKNYGGELIYHKHELYESFLRHANPQERDYFAIASIRNPLDIVVTRYFKRKADHQGFLTNPNHWREYGGHISKKARREYEFIVNNQNKFADYFLKFYKLPFDNRGSPRPDDFDFVIHFEQLQEDFSALLDQLGIRQARPIPVVNKTIGKEPNFLECFTPETYKWALWVFGPCINLWGYDFPTDWGTQKKFLTSQVLFSLLRYVRKQIHEF